MTLHVPASDGRWVSEEFARLAEMIQDYDRFLELRWIPPEQRLSLEDKSKPYVIWDTRIDSKVMFASELDPPVAILAKLFDIDNKNGDVLKRLDAYNNAVKAIELKKELERREEAMELSTFVIKNQKSRWRHNGNFYDDEFRNLGTGKKVI